MAVSVKLAADIDRRLRALAREMSCSHHFMMCEAIKRYVEDEEARLRIARAQMQIDESPVRTGANDVEETEHPRRALAG